jgi:cytochrome c oxidase subunit 4
MAHLTIDKKVYYAVCAALLVLTGITVGIAFLDLGPLNTLVALLIAVGKALLVLLYFMHVRYSSRLTWVCAGAAFFWLGILLVLTLSDVLTRGWLPVSGG